jgi:formylglycine-generating enzyme required for sulfatase activity
MKTKINPTGPQSGSYRVVRGGGWGNGARYLRSADRFTYGPDLRCYAVGFRLVRTPVSLGSFTLLPLEKSDENKD